MIDPLDREALDREYNAELTVPSVAPYFERYAAESARVRGRLDSRLNVHYGPDERQAVDFFPAGKPGAPTLVYVHGGYWRRLSKNEYSFVAEPFVAAGANAAIVGYRLAPAHSLDEIVADVRAAFALVLSEGAQFGLDTRRIHVAGHSAGGQLAGMLLATPGLELAGICAISGLFDLEPLRHSFVNEWLKLDADSAARNSPNLLPPASSCPAIVAVGDHETSEFKRQSREYAAALAARGLTATSMLLPGLNHYSIVPSLLDPASSLRRALFTQMGL